MGLMNWKPYVDMQSCRQRYPCCYWANRDRYISPANAANENASHGLTAHGEFVAFLLRNLRLCCFSWSKSDSGE
jgi:hypothetical protein